MRICLEDVEKLNHGADEPAGRPRVRPVRDARDLLEVVSSELRLPPIGCRVEVSQVPTEDHQLRIV